MTATQQLSDWMRRAFAAVDPSSATASAEIQVVPCANPAFGDFQCNHAMALARAIKRKPQEVAKAALSAVPVPQCVLDTSIAGAGFINIRVKSEGLSLWIEDMTRDSRLLAPSPGAGKTILIDYSSPNIAKPMHIGHIRTNNIGSALDRMHRFLGYNVISDNHIGDWGTQFGILIMGFRNFLDRNAYSTDPVAELERLYVLSYGKSQSDPSWLEQCRRELVKLQAGDPENTSLWRDFISVSMKSFEAVYSRLGISFNLVRGESYYNNALPELTERLERTGLARQSEGALVVFLDDEKLPPCIVRKSDGGFNYAATDIATIESRMKEFHPDAVVYVTDERQQLHFRQVFAVARKAGCPANLVHVWFGLMRLPEGTFSTRQGNVIPLEKLLNEAESRALAVVKQTSPDMPPDRQAEVARAVGIGAIKYIDLSQNPQTLVTFTWDKALALDGNSAPYLQYAYARIASVRDKYLERFPTQNPDSFPIRIEEDLERRLALLLLKFGDTVSLAASSYRPNILTDYLFDLAQTYSTFYQNVPFLKADTGVRESRVRLSCLVAAVLKQGLALLGIETPERL